MKDSHLGDYKLQVVRGL